jgi:hypothetical protein
MTMVLHVEGASPEELARGLAAARAVLNAAGVADVDAAWAAHVRERWDISAFADEYTVPGAELAAASALDEASAKAIAACCAGWPSVPPGAHLDVVAAPA